MLLSTLAVVLCAIALGDARSVGRRTQIIEEKTAANRKYDFIISGGGLAGLTVANRLTEDPSVSVLVIEAGQLDARDDTVLIPGSYNPFPYLWQGVFTPPQPGLLNRIFMVLMGKVVGGGSAVNAMFFHRPSEIDQASWVNLGAKGWSFSDLLPYYKKSENFTTPDPTFAAARNISWEDGFHGSDGPIHASYAPYDYPSGENFWDAGLNIGLKQAKDANSGIATGLFYLLRALNPLTGTRSYARVEHYDRVIATRPNYHLLPNTVVGKVLFNGTLATGVEFLNATSGEKTTVFANKEVIISSGAVHTPQVLQLSGVGPRALLESLGIEVVVDLPGVGQNFQDQSALTATYNFTNNLFPNGGSLDTNATYSNEQLALYNTSQTGAYTIVRGTGNQAVALSLQDLTRNHSSLLAHAKAQDPSAIYAPGTHPTVLAGYLAQREELYSLLSSKESPMGNIFWNTGPSTSIYMLKPFSRGSIAITSLSPLDAPTVDFRTNSDDTDLLFHLSLFLKNRELMSQPSMITLGPIETGPGAGINDADTEGLKTALAGAIEPSNAHMCCTAPMMKIEYGGVVDAELRVYGTSGLSVMDNSIFPMPAGAAPSAVIYAAAEKAAVMIKARHGL
ncbi:hypothetical protein HYFRA_00000152 [Hymenoscyphus fraxineus]|uniref:Glucose-methanol-choline oxidoreductase N-terminal domain-containing protein n=1 Tax=Hymenoscyphus fraxineus TaxID=746836 RepID=A0A9N9L454_9HELO|nr:hypothetical protein HYFRA_00000152 [Hymenoscyphus fraxineus]